MPLDGKARKRHCFSIVDPSVRDVRLFCCGQQRTAHPRLPQRSDGVPISLAADSADEAEAWLSLLLCACVPTTWPGKERDCTGRQVKADSRIQVASASMAVRGRY